ncbi:hypothetical protein AB0M28_27685 [Streptomyces sp. NPDC051940]|uniref:hypothetical protein n=1 Tax=Streptomyces sp. NPDC051940 TaxID=3155675 RepID=UPI003443C4E3
MSSPNPYAVPQTAPAPVMPPPARRSAGPLVLAAAVGVLLGAAGVGAAWAFSGGETGAAADARDACRALDEVDMGDFGAKGAPGDVAVNRFAAAVSLSASAAAGDPDFKGLAKAVAQAQRELQVTFDPRSDKMRARLDKARGICADL